MGSLVALIPVLQIIVKYAPGLVEEIVSMFSSTGGNPTAADWKALSDKVANTPFDAPPTKG